MRGEGKPIKIFFAMAENLKEGPLKDQLHKKGIERGLVCVKVYLANKERGEVDG